MNIITKFYWTSSSHSGYLFFKTFIVRRKVIYFPEGTQLNANAPPIVPRIAPTTNPPIPMKLIIENSSIIKPCVLCSAGLVFSINALIVTKIPAAS